LFVLLIPAAAKLALHLLTVRGYGIHGDELYYLACSDHLDWGYVDQPPLSLLLLHMQRLVFGDSLLSLRALPALAGSLTVLLTGLLAHRLGAKTFGQLLAELCALIAPAYLAVSHIFSMNVFDLVFWLAALHLIVRIIDGGAPTLWVWLGLVVGLGFQNKLSILFLCFGLAVGLLLTKERRSLFTPWLGAGVGLAALLMLPNIIWQATHGWPTLEWMANARSMKMVSLTLPAYLLEQVILMHPLTVLVWGAGLVSLLFYRSLARYRSLGWCYLIVLAMLVGQGGKPYYFIPIYPLLFAVGAIVIERSLKAGWARAAVAVVLLAAGAALAPTGLPLLPPEGLIKYSNALGIHASSGERSAQGRIPWFFATMFGWEELVAKVDDVYRTLPPEDQAKCSIFCRNYMQAGAVDFYGWRYHLPQAICGHNNYWLWGLRGYSGEVMIVLGGKVDELKQYYEDVTEFGRFEDEYIQPIHNNLPIFVVGRPKQPLALLWPKIKNYI